MRECGQVEGEFCVVGVRWDTLPCSLFLHHSSYIQLEPLIPKSHFHGSPTKQLLSFTFFFVACPFSQKKGTCQFERPEADLFSTIFYLHITCITPPSFYSVLQASNLCANHSLAFQVGHLETSWTLGFVSWDSVRDLENRVDDTILKSKMGRCICAYGFLGCSGDE